MYDKKPFIAVGTESECHAGWSAVMEVLRAHVDGVMCIECYPGVLLDELQREIRAHLPHCQLVRTDEAFLEPAFIAQNFEEQLSDDPVFGKMAEVELQDFLDPDKLSSLRGRIDATQPTIVLGPAAAVIWPNPALLVYADLARWEIQRRQRGNLIANLGLRNEGERAALKYKRAYFLDWRAADRLKKRLFDRIDFLLDTNEIDHPRLISGDAFRRGLRKIVCRPFRVVPFFDPGPWGGHWMERVCQLPQDGAPNHAWCFDCVPEENSVLLGFGSLRVEIPAIDAVFFHPKELLGEAVFRSFGAEFPIRFDFLDTVGGGNLSLQVHPLKEYIREHFGMDYTQDESYYMLDAEPEATVYLGIKEGIDPKAMVADLERAQRGEIAFPAEKYVNRFPARKHDHFLIPAGTVHCSGKGSMVLEISATPYIFTFKLWDWGRLGLDGRPRPIHLEHGKANIQWDRTTEWVQQSLINQFEPVQSGDGWREERTGLHPLEFIETRRLWFRATCPLDTCGTVHVLNLVEGEQALVESPTGAFDPFEVHYAETFIVPAAVGPYTIRPDGLSIGKECATMLAYIR
jgi:mannose-6-phosphate isomerase class I